jgi:recombination protein RecA
MDTLEQVMKDLNKKFNATVVQKGANFEDVQKVPLSCFGPTYMLYGGLPVGRMCEFFGKESSAKSTLALDAMKQFQKAFPDKRVLYLDVEGTFDTKWAELNGVDVSEERFVLFTPEAQNATEILDAIIALVDTGEFSLAVLDSIGALSPDAEIQKGVDGVTYGGVAREMTRFCRLVTSVLRRNDCTLIVINQIREKLNSPYGGVDTPGGKALKHGCSVRMEFRPKDFVDDDFKTVSQQYENPAGQIMQVRLVKSKVCPSDRKISSFILTYLGGLETNDDLIEIGITLNHVSQKGAYYKAIIVDEDGVVTESDNVQGRKAFRDYLAANDDIREALIENILADI